MRNILDENSQLKQSLSQPSGEAVLAIVTGQEWDKKLGLTVDRTRDLKILQYILRCYCNLTLYHWGTSPFVDIATGVKVYIQAYYLMLLP